MQQLPKFFDWRGELGRIEYFYAVVWRGFIYLCIVAINYGLSALWGWDVAFTEESDWSWIFTDPFVTVAEFVIFVPIVIRRLSDVGISLWWIFAFEALILLIPKLI